MCVDGRRSSTVFFSKARGPVSENQEGGNRSVLATLDTNSNSFWALFRTLVLICFAHTSLGDQRVQPRRDHLSGLGLFINL